MIQSESSGKINTLAEPKESERKRDLPEEEIPREPTEQDLQYEWHRLFGGDPQKVAFNPLEVNEEVYLDAFFWETTDTDDVSMWYRRGYADGSVSQTIPKLGGGSFATGPKLDTAQKEWYDTDNGRAYLSGWEDARGDLDS